MMNPPAIADRTASVAVASPAPQRTRRRVRLSLSKPLIYGLLFAYLVIVAYPMLWLAYTSLKPDEAIFRDPFALPALGDLRWQNYTNAWVKASFGRYFFNSVILTVSTVVVTTLLAAMTAFALTRYRFRGATPLLFFMLAGMVIPVQLAVVPLFFQMKQWHLLNTLPGIFLVYVGFGLPFSVFVLSGFFKTLPASLHESARLDGCSEWQVFWHVMLPMSKAGLVTVAVFLFLGNWNEYFVALICLSGKGSDAWRTLPLGLANITIVSQYRSDWGTAFAGLVLMMLPTLLMYAVLQKQISKGITAGAVKG